jgi:hypothetical protein
MTPALRARELLSQHNAGAQIIEQSDPHNPSAPRVVYVQVPAAVAAICAAYDQGRAEERARWAALRDAVAELPLHAWWTGAPKHVYQVEPDAWRRIMDAKAALGRGE